MKNRFFDLNKLSSGAYLSYFKQIEFNTEDTKVKHTNITTKIKRKVFTKVIKMPSKEACV